MTPPPRCPPRLSFDDALLLWRAREVHRVQAFFIGLVTLYVVLTLFTFLVMGRCTSGSSSSDASGRSGGRCAGGYGGSGSASSAGRGNTPHTRKVPMLTIIDEITAAFLSALQTGGQALAVFSLAILAVRAVISYYREYSATVMSTG